MHLIAFLLASSVAAQVTYVQVRQGSLQDLIEEVTVKMNCPDGSQKSFSLFGSRLMADMPVPPSACKLAGFTRTGTQVFTTEGDENANDDKMAIFALKLASFFRALNTALRVSINKGSKLLLKELKSNLRKLNKTYELARLQLLIKGTKFEAIFDPWFKLLGQNDLWQRFMTQLTSLTSNNNPKMPDICPNCKQQSPIPPPFRDDKKENKCYKLTDDFYNSLSSVAEKFGLSDVASRLGGRQAGRSHKQPPKAMFEAAYAHHKSASVPARRLFKRDLNIIPIISLTVFLPLALLLSIGYLLEGINVAARKAHGYAEAVPGLTLVLFLASFGCFQLAKMAWSVSAPIIPSVVINAPVSIAALAQWLLETILAESENVIKYF